MNRLSNEELLSILRTRLNNGSPKDQEQQLLREIAEVSEKLKKSEEMKSHFLSNIRNEINNPLSSVLGLTEFLAGGNLTAEQLKRTASLLYTEIFNLDFQMQNIFAAADIEAGETTLEPVNVQVHRLLDDVLNAFRFKAAQKQVVLSKVVQSGDVELFTDAHKLHLVLRNLVANAIEFSHVGGEVTITCEMKDENLVIAVADRGPGMTELEQSQLFRRFHQLERGHTKTHSGHGLGLSVAKELVELLGGEIRVQSSKGNGTTFTIYLPLVQQNTTGRGAAVFQDEFIFGSEQIL